MKPVLDSRGKRGFTVVEFLIAAIVFLIVTGLAGSYLVQQMVYTQRTQARNEMQANLRAAMEMVTADLFNAGSEGVGAPCSWSGPSLAIDGEQPFRHEIVNLQYCNPYGTGPVSVNYRVAQEGDTPTLWRNGGPAVPGIAAFELDVVCADGPCDLLDLDGKILFVNVRMLARTIQPVRGAVASGIVFRNASVSDLVQANVVQSDFMYEASERRLVLPNLGR